MTTEATATDFHAFTENWLEWYRAQEARLADPHGFLAITGLHWLDDRPQRFPDAPGAWRTGPDGVVVDLDDGEELVVDGTPVRGEHRFGVLPERGGVDAGWGDAVIEVAKRGGNDIVRPRHPDAPLRTAFTGTPAYAPDPRWAVTGRYIPFDSHDRPPWAPPSKALSMSTTLRADRVRAGRTAAVPDRVPRPWCGPAVGAVHRRDLRSHHLRGQPLPRPGPARRRRHGRPGLQPGRRTCRAPTRTWPPARCRRPRTGCRWLSRPARRSPASAAVPELDKVPVQLPLQGVAFRHWPTTRTLRTITNGIECQRQALAR